MLTALVCLSICETTPRLHLIPTPKSVIRETGEFPLGRHADLIVTKPSDDEDSFAAEQLIEESPDSFGWPSKRRPKIRVTIGRIGRDKAIDKVLASEHIRVDDASGPESYALVVKPTGIVCAGRTSAGTFYAVQTLKQLVRANRSTTGIPCVKIVDSPSLTLRGWQDDISRGPIPTLEFLKKEVRELSEYKLNAFTLYTEHVFKLKKHPSIAPDDGISAKEVQELDRYCKKYHMQLIGNFQSFGHFANILKVPGYENLKETSDVITPAKEESYKFLKDVYDEIAPAYSSSLFNINCDETYGLGEGPAKEMVAKEGLGNVYAKHINRVASLLKTHGKTPMMWGDIALQYPDIRKNLPKDLIVLTWGYDPRASFVDQIEPFTKIGFKFLVCPGVSCWGQNFPDLESATTNISNFVRDGSKLGALGMLNTTWDDTGENLFNNNWYPLVWGAEVSWSPVTSTPDIGGGSDSRLIDDILADNAPRFSDQMKGVDDVNRKARLAEFDEAFPRLFFGLPDGSLSKALWKLSDLRQQPVSAGQSDQAFWKAPWQTDTLALKESPSFVKDVAAVTLTLQHAQSDAKRNRDSLVATQFAAQKMSYLGDQAALVSQVPKLLVSDSGSGHTAALKALPSLESEMAKLKESYVRAWKIENMPWWLDRVTAKYDRAAANDKYLSVIPMFDPPSGPLKAATQVRVSALDQGEMRYTLDGSTPTEASPIVRGPIEVSKSCKLTVINIGSNLTSPAVSATYNILTRPCHIATLWNHYGDHTPEMAFDGMLDTYFWSFGSVAKDSTFTVDFDDPDMVSGVVVTTGHPEHPEDYLHEGVLEASTDGQKFKEIAKFKNGVAETGMIGFRVKALRIRVTKDNGNWLVIREIALK